MTDIAGTRVLIVDDEATSRRLLEVRLRTMGCEVVMAGDGQEALSIIQQEIPALMLLDLQMPRMDGMELLRALRRDSIDLPTIVITAHGSIETAVEAMKEGAYDFLPKPFDPKHLEIVVRKALERRQLVESNRFLKDVLAARTPDILGESPLVRRAVDLARKVAATNSTVLLLGESGTGKEVFAHAIHQWSPLRREPEAPLNIATSRNCLLATPRSSRSRGSAFHPWREPGDAKARDGRSPLPDSRSLSKNEQTNVAAYDPVRLTARRDRLPALLSGAPC